MNNCLVNRKKTITDEKKIIIALIAINTLNYKMMKNEITLKT